MQIKENGISKKRFNSLSSKEKTLLEKKGEKYFLRKEERKKIKVGLTGGVFDILHIGHVFTLNEAKKYCDVLVVVIACNKHILNKKRKILHSEKYRAAMVEFLKPVDAVILGCTKYEKTLKYIMPDRIIYGYDQKPFLKPNKIKVIKLKKYVEPKKFKSNKIIKMLGL